MRDLERLPRVKWDATWFLALLAGIGLPTAFVGYLIIGAIRGELLGWPF